MNRVWITRTRPAADASADIWRDAGFDPIVEPLLDVQSVPHQPISDQAVLIFTSKNGIDHIDCAGQRAICVGDATAKHAIKAGFSDVVSVDGTSDDVTKWVCANVQGSKSLVHISGWHVRGSIIEDLQAEGYAASRVKVYRSIPRTVWPESPSELVAFYSPLAARTFADLAVGQSLSGLSAICISQATAEALSNISLRSVHIAARPREDELIMSAKRA
ncbi:MAG: uroporphyrinogen-III synthase [Litorimonas sp.]